MVFPWSGLLLSQVLFLDYKFRWYMENSEKSGIVLSSGSKPFTSSGNSLEKRVFPRRHSYWHQSESDSDDSQESLISQSSSIYDFSLLSENDGQLHFDDPLYPRQWYLHNRNFPGHDINVIPVWKEGITGKGVVIALIDDGVDYDHLDLKDGFRKDLSYDFNSGQLLPVPDPQLRDHHGTRCAGQIVSRPNNGICGVGIAPDAQISAIRILSMAVSSKNEAAAVTHKYNENHIYSCSWGPADDGKAIDTPDSAVLKSFIDGVINGRNGKGSIYVFAAGNGKLVDNCNFDGYASGIFALTVGAIDHDHKMPAYMEPCSAQLVVSYSSNDQYKIATTDLGGNKCTLKHGGTSAAAPIVTGILALVLSVRPDLRWRDVRHICVESAIPISTDDASWKKNGAGRLYSHKFGFGKVDANKIVTMAKEWKSVARQAVRSLPIKLVNQPISATETIIDQINLTGELMRKLNLTDISSLEYVTVRFNIKHSSRGDLIIHLQSPSGMVIPLITRRPLDKSDAGLIGIIVMTVAFWGESIEGVWTLRVTNAPKTSSHGLILDYRIAFWGPLKDEIHETDEVYAQMFLNNYYPPTDDFFIDKDGIWDETIPAVSRETLKISFELVFILCIILLLLCLVLWKLNKRWGRRRFSPIPPRFNSSPISLSPASESAVLSSFSPVGGNGLKDKIAQIKPKTSIPIHSSTMARSMVEASREKEEYNNNGAEEIRVSLAKEPNDTDSLSRLSISGRLSMSDKSSITIPSQYPEESVAFNEDLKKYKPSLDSNKIMYMSDQAHIATSANLAENERPKKTSIDKTELLKERFATRTNERFISGGKFNDLSSCAAIEGLDASDLIKSMVEKSISEAMSEIRNDIQNLHIELIKQSIAQQNTLRQIAKNLPDSYKKLVEDYRLLQEENERMKLKSNL